MSKENYTKIALSIIKKCQGQGDSVYETCIKEKGELFTTSLAGSWDFHCANQKRLEQTFCLHDEKNKAAITSSGFRSTS